MNLLTDPVFALTGDGKVSLPQLFSEMAQGRVSGFAALRPHQRPAWHMFLVQLAALSLWASGHRELMTSVDAWTAALRHLTKDHEDDSPWQLVVADKTKPAFLQPPVPKGLAWSPIVTPDNLDMLITARNHDVKQLIAWDAEPEDWIYALVSLQTCEGFGGRGNYGIARMNGGSSSRPLLGLVPARSQADLSVNPSAWWSRDVRYLLDARDEGQIVAPGTSGGPALLWCLAWSEGEQLRLPDLDPWFIEVCRRVRMSNCEGKLSAHRATSKAARIDAKAFKGNTGDPWTPMHKDGKSLTLGSGDFDYNHLCNYLFSGDWVKPVLAQPRRAECRDMLLVAEAFARGNSKTEGFKSRVVPVPGAVVSNFTAQTLGTLAKAQMEEIKIFDKSLGYAIALLAAGGERDKVDKGHYHCALAARKRFDASADLLFFPSLWRRIMTVNAGCEERASARSDFLHNLWCAAQDEFTAAMSSVPCACVLRPRAEVRARRALHNRIRREYPDAFRTEKRDVPH